MENGEWGMGNGDWGLGIRDWGLGIGVPIGPPELGLSVGLSVGWLGKPSKKKIAHFET